MVKKVKLEFVYIYCEVARLAWFGQWGLRFDHIKFTSAIELVQLFVLPHALRKGVTRQGNIIDRNNNFGCSMGN